MNINIIVYLEISFIIVTIEKGIRIFKRFKKIEVEEIDSVLEFGFWLGFAFIPSIIIVLLLINDISKCGGIYSRKEENATVISVGNRGICIEYDGEYGKDTITKDVNDNVDYNIGDIVTIEITDSIFFAEPEIYVKKADG